jgi:hypothetical protein
LLASIQVNEFGMTPHWYKEVTHTAPKYKGVAYTNELDKGSSDSEGMLTLFQHFMVYIKSCA